ncbi:MAG: hypothetical protein ACJAXX_001212 [Roseivirga sp.]|jgi:hypothetical protein
MINGNKRLSRLEEEVIRVLAYYQIFHHPLMIKEVARFINIGTFSAEALNDALKTLLGLGVVFEFDGYYSLKNEASLVPKRLEGEVRAKSLMKMAKGMSRLIYFFPFVRAVFISGSLSKGVVPKDADIDYFIITKRNRLWIARTILVVFKRLFLLGSKKYFCVNYFVDEDHMEIPDKNMFTATEVVTLIPMQVDGFGLSFMKCNEWYDNFFPNVNLNKIDERKESFIKRCSIFILEPPIFSSLAEMLDKHLLKKTYKRWQTLYNQGYSDKEFELAFRTQRGTSKNHDKNYQKRVLNAVEGNVKSVMSKIKIQEIHE